MKINILKLTLLILSSTFLISCGSTKQVFDYGSVKTSNQIETIKISNINNLPICKVLIGEKEYNFLIDTGAPTVIPNEIFQRLKLKSFFTEEITDANNKKRKQNFTILPEIKIDNLIFKEIGCVVMDIETPALKCFGFDGIIGANLLAKMVWQFDFSKNEFRATLDFKNFNQKYDYIIPFEYKNQKSPKINGKIFDKELSFTLDTGYNGKISINEDYQSFIKKIDENKIIKTIGANTVGLFGKDDFKNNLIIKGDFELGGILFKNELITSGNSTIIGNEFLKDYLFTIDWTTKKMYFKIINSPIKRTIKSFGFSYIFKDNKAFVVTKFENQSIPIELNDRILMINKIDFSNLSNEKACEYSLKKIDDSFLDDIEVTVERNGKILTYKLTKKDFIQ